MTALTRQPRVSDFAALHELLLISAVTTILVIRTQLWLTHYPARRSWRRGGG